MVSPESIRIFSVIVPLFMLAIGMKRPLWAVIGYMMLVYCKVAHYYPVLGSMRAELVLGLVTFLRVISSENLSILKPTYNAVSKYLLFFIFTVAFSFLFALDRQHAWDEAVYHFIKTMLLYVMIVASVRTIQDIKIFIWSFLGMFCYLAYEPVFRFVTGVGGDVQSYGVNYIADVGILSGHVSLANNMNQMIPIAFFLIPTVQNKVLKIIAISILAIFIFALIGSGSRGGVVGFTVFCANLVYFSKRRIKNAIILGAGICILFFLSNPVSNTARINLDQTSGRLLGIIHGIEMIRIYGHVFGVGPGCFMIARGRYFGHTMMSHNIYGEVLGDLGILGTLAWGLFIFHTIRNITETKKRLEFLSMESNFLYKLCMALLVSLIVRLFISLGSHGLYYIYWYLIAGISIVLVNLVDKIEEDNMADKNLKVTSPV